MPIDPQQIVAYLRSEAGRPLKAKELAKGLGVAQADYAEFKELLARLEDEGVLYRVQKQRYAAPERINLVVGRFQAIRSGAGFVVPDEGGDDVFIGADALESAMDGDRVVARIERRRRGQRIEGRIIKVLDRARERVVGIFHPAGGRDDSEFGFVVPNDRKLTRDLYVAPGGHGSAADGDLVVVQVTDWGGGHRNPAGTVVEVIGPPDAPGNDILAIIHDHDIDRAFPDEVEAEAAAIQERGIRPGDFEGRTDLRDLLVFTIDPADAKDHDDALSVVALDDGLWEVGVHIADVSFYVKEGSPLDLEALERGTSVYLVDRVIPMLPHALSSDLCSLRAGVDRLAMSLFVRLDADGNARGHRLERSILQSRHKLSYDEAQQVLDGERSIDAETDEALHTLLRLSRALRAQRSERGSIDFDLPEARVVLGASGEPTDIQRIERLDTHKLIEDFMLLANETLARTASRRKVPIPYRIHEPPDEMRMEQLRDFAAGFGLKLGGRGAPSPAQVQALLESARGRPVERLFSTVVLRSMKQARYSEENRGHFGLAATHYTHFTSPIRRYADLLLHRIVGRRFIERGRDARSPSAEEIAPLAQRTSERERVAVSAERDSIDLKKVQFMERHLGDEFGGTVSDVRAFGFFVLLDDFFVDGLVHVSSLEDDYYAFVEERYSLVGQNTGRSFRPGDRVRVQVARVNREERKIDFLLLQAESARDEDLVDDGRRSGQRKRGRGGSKPGGRPQGGSGSRAKGNAKKGGRTKSRSKKAGATGAAKSKSGARGGRKGEGRGPAKRGKPKRGRKGGSRRR